MPLIRSKVASTPQSQVQQLVYTVTQSSIIGSVPAGTYQNLTDGDVGQTGTGTGQDNQAWIKADLGAVKTVRLVAFRGGIVTGWGTNTKYNLEGKYLQSSVDGNSFTYQLVIGNVPNEDSVNVYPNIPYDGSTDWIEKFSDCYLSRKKLYCVIPLNIQARYLRVFGSGYTALSEWLIFGF